MEATSTLYVIRVSMFKANAVFSIAAAIKNSLLKVSTEALENNVTLRDNGFLLSFFTGGIAWEKCLWA